MNIQCGIELLNIDYYEHGFVWRICCLEKDLS